MRVLFIKKPLVLGAMSVFGLFLLIGFASSFLFNESVPSSTIADGQPIYQGSSERKEIALTCNVFWGEEYLPPMLEILERNEVPVTFFVGGTWAERFPELTRELLTRGHEIGSHGYSHPHPDRISKDENLKDIKKCEDILKKLTGKRPVLYAPPYGERGPAVLQAANEAGYKTILWSIDTVDWKRPPADSIVEKVVSNAHNGAIVLIHPTEPTVGALSRIIKELKDQGYALVTVSQLLREENNISSTIDERE